MDLLPLRWDLRNWRSTGVTILAAALTSGLAKLSRMVSEQPPVQRGHTCQYNGIAGSRLQKS
jgi:hypothetical protein